MKKYLLNVINAILGTNKMYNQKEKIDTIVEMCGNYFPYLQIINFLEYRHLSNSGFGELQILCDKYGSDKGSIFINDSIHPYPWSAHTYANIYEILFASIRNEVKYVFECGIGTNNINVLSNMTSNGRPGASLYVWNDYFNSSIINIYGADIDRDILFNNGKIKTFYMDQTKKESVLEYFRNLNNVKFDIMIDDGLHTSDAAITLFENSIQNLSENGIYFIEDMGGKYLIDIYEYFHHTNEFNVNYITMLRGAKTDNNLIVIKKKIHAQ